MVSMAKTALAEASAGQLEMADAATRLADCGIRVTDPRLQIASILLSAPRHLSAEQIAEMLRSTGARVSKATIYNTLNLFAARGLIRQLSVDGNCAWFDSNVSPHYHFRDEQTGQLSDVALSEVQFSRLPQPPPGTEMAGVDVVIRLRRRKEH
jgi:Fur family transcriptional regulator, iron response regulator